MSDQQREPVQNLSEVPPKPSWRELKPNHIPKRFRTLFPVRRSDHLVDRALFVLWPWDRSEYPGLGRLRQWLTGLGTISSANQYRKNPLRVKTAKGMLARLETKASEINAVIAELREFLDGRYLADEEDGKYRQSVKPPTVD